MVMTLPLSGNLGYCSTDDHRMEAMADDFRI
jgi:hypothetical protein